MDDFMKYKMAQTKTSEEKLEEVLAKNKELILMVQFLKIQHKKVEDEKFTLQKENNDLILKNREYTSKIKHSYILLKNLVNQSFEEFLKFSNNVDNIGRVINEYDGVYDTTSRETFLNGTTGSSLNNVHHVRPMIGGVTLKTPILRVSRANIDIFNGRVQAPKKENVTQSPVESNTSPNIETQEVSVTLERIDTIGFRKAIFKERTDENKPIPVVSLPRIDIRKRSPCSAENGRKSDFMSLEYSPKVNTSEERLENRSLSTSFRDTISDNKENSFTNGEEYMDDFQPSDNLSNYSTRLGCIPEETENNSTPESSNVNSTSIFPSSQTPKKRHIYSSSGISKYAGNSSEDPLEGPSWRFNDNQETPQNSFNFDNDCECDDSLIKNIKQISNSSIDENDIEDNGPQFRSTPHNWKSVKNRVCTALKISISLDEQSTTQSNIEQNSKDVIIDTEKSKDFNATKTKNGLSKADKKDHGKEKKIKTPPKIRKTTSRFSKRNGSSTSNTSKSSILVPSVDSPSDSANACDRPRRTAKIDYKEKSAKIKLRRDK
ncbi:uncharacterized protein LOC143918527 [Arctopsyche grandis]|uniref:uncharacterized protein LOC143918527 n=1 Tax=Arctopsyche grandis TaxID=121162 RepID=UPI00406D9D96